MDEQITSIIVASIGLLGSIGAALIASKKQVSKDISKISDKLPSWKLLYEHDSNGIRISGTTENLIEAIGSAYPIKVKIFRSKDRFDMMDAQWLFVENDFVHASNTEQISITKDQNGEFVYVADAYHYFVIVNSEGRHHASRVYIDGRKGYANDDKRRMAWYGLVPPK